jgi:putative transferase (TIGR04331 family)
LTNQKRFLITVADESTWKFDNPVIFLGQWCLLDEKKPVWEKLDFIIGNSSGINSETKNKNLETSIRLETKLFPELVNILNKLHGTSYSIRFWKIIIGHSFQTFTNILINRLNSYSIVFDSSAISGAKFFNLSEEDFTPENTYDLDFYFVNSDIWQSTLDYKLLSLMENIKFPCEIIEQTSNFKSSVSFVKNNESSDSLRKKIKIKVKSIGKYFLKENDSLIISTYLPKFREYLLHLSFKQAPQFWEDFTYSYPIKTVSKSIRADLASKINLEDKFESIVLKFIVSYLPTLYVEGFKEMLSIVENSTWPRKPKFIFTSNEFAYNEHFKFYAAIQSEKGVAYYVGQHGNNYGTNKFISPSVEELTATKFLTWGWSDNNNSIPTFVLKTAGLKLNHNPRGKVTLMLLHPNARRLLWDTSIEYQSYISDQIRFLINLVNLPSSNLCVRSHPATLSNRERILKKYLFDNDIEYDDSTNSVFNVYKKSRLLIFSYDSTGILEALTSNIPTLAFWQNGLDHLNDSAKIQYQKMIEAGIFYLSPESLAKTVNEIWDSVEYWWNQESIQIAREEFCRQYARSSKSPIKDLRKILKENLH